MTPHVLFIESNTTGTGRLFALAARTRGLIPVLLTTDPARYPYVAEEQMAFRIVTTHDPLAVRDAIRAFEGPIAGITSSSEYFVDLASTLAAARGLSAGDGSAIRFCRNKWNQRRVLSAAGLPTPRFVRVVTPGEAQDAAAWIGLPAIVKPTCGTGSVGVRVCATLAEVAAQASSLLAVRANERGLPVAAEALIEEMVTGDEYSVETFGRSIVGITAKHVSAPPYFVETGHDFPAALDAPREAMIANTVLRALSLLGLTWGAAHTELRLTPRGAVIMEVNPRLAGGFIPEIVRLATGIDLIDAVIALVTGAPVDLHPTRAGAASIRFLVAEDGTFERADGVETILAQPGIAAVAIYRRAGDVCTVRHDFRDRAGHVIATAGSIAESADLAAQARAGIQLRCVQASVPAA